MKQIAIISADESLRRIFAVALESADEPMSVSEFDSCCEAFCARGFDVVILLGVSSLLSGRFSLDMLERRDDAHPKVYVISWQHGEQTVMSLLECGVAQYMTFPLNISRLLLKIIG